MYDNSKSTISHGCVSASYTLKHGAINKKYSTQYKKCLVKKIRDDGTRFNVYLRSAYKQPFIGKWKFFVLYKFIMNPAAGKEERESVVNDEVMGTLRHITYLSLDI